MEFAVLVL